MELEGELNLADIVTESVVDGLGIRFVIFVQGCPHRCNGCHNPATHDMSGGVKMSLTKIAELIDKDPLLSGITFSGGEPMLYPVPAARLSDYVHSKGMSVWCYTGYTYEELLEMAKDDPAYKDFLDRIDVLVDGRFIEEQKDINLAFRGSKNQRLIDLKRMRKENSDTVLVLEKLK